MDDMKMKDELFDSTLETDYLLLEQAAQTATSFLTIDELIADYKKLYKGQPE